ncbi:hypothetical protein HMPREF1582_00796, partial [Gardnerella vaginalis JCP8151A]
IMQLEIVDSQQKAEDNKKALRKSQQVKLTTIRTEPMLKINPNGLPPIANSAKSQAIAKSQ